MARGAVPFRAAASCVALDATASAAALPRLAALPVAGSTSFMALSSASSSEASRLALTAAVLPVPP
eukprot:13079292-Alexandrium_andersonii.AAC.1